MTQQPPPDDMDALALRTTDRASIVEAITATCAEESLVRAPPARLRGFGHFLRGEEDPSLRRFLVAAPSPPWTVVLLSVPDWAHLWLPKLLRRLPVPAAYLMLHDGDCCTLHCYDGPEQVGELVTSWPHFDMEPRERDPGLAEALSFLAGRDVTEAEVERCCFPPGRIDVDGRLAHSRIRELLGLPAETCGAYGLSLEEDGRTPRDEFSSWIHACFQDADEAKADEELDRSLANREAGDDADGDPAGSDRVVPFRRRDEDSE